MTTVKCLTSSIILMLCWPELVEDFAVKLYREILP